MVDKLAALENLGPTGCLKDGHLELPEVVAALEPPQRVPFHVDVVDAEVRRIDRIPLPARSKDRVIGIALCVVGEVHVVVVVAGVLLIPTVVEVTQE